MKRINFLLVLIFTLSVAFNGCRRQQPAHPAPQVNITATTALAGQNFDLQALGELVVKYPDPEDLIREVNKSGGINNLDIDEDGNVDFISVREGDNSSGQVVELVFEAQLADGKTDICSVNYDKVNQQVTIAGNPSYYPSDAYYVRPYVYPSTFFWFSPYRAHYVNPYYYGYYPSYYNPYVSVGFGAYSSRSVVRTARTTTTYKKTSRPQSSTNKSWNNTSSKAKSTAQKTQTAKKNNQKIGSQTQTQKQIQKRDANKKVDASGFSKKPTNTSSNKPNQSKTTPKPKTSPKPTKKSYSAPSRSRSTGGGSRSRSKCDSTAKENINYCVEYGLSEILALNVASFNYDSEHVVEEGLPETNLIGFIAQDVRTVIPEAVSVDEKGELVMDYFQVVAVLVRAVQQQDSTINQLQMELNGLKNKD